MIDPKAWKAVSAKYKIKDNGLDKALTGYNNLDEDANDDRLKAVSAIGQLANALKKAKEVLTSPEAVKFLATLSGAADKEKGEVLKRKQAAEKNAAAAAKAQDEKKRSQDAADDSNAKDEKQEGGFKALTLSMLQKVKGAKPDAPYQYLLCEAKPLPFVLIAKQINASHRKMLEKLSGGSKRFLKPGAVTFEDGHYCFESEKDIPGAARRVQGFFKNLTGKKFPVMFGSQKASDEEEGAAKEGAEGSKGKGAETAAGAAGAVGAEAGAAGATAPAASKGGFSISASVGQGGKNKQEDVQAVQTALNAKAKAGLTVDGKCG